MRLFLAPARINNIKSTIQKRVPFSLIENKIPLDKYNKIWSGIKNSLGFYCWAMQSGRSETCFRKMRKNDIVLIKSKGDPCFKYKGRVVLTLDCIELGNLLWSEGGNWEFIYFFEEIEEIRLVEEQEEMVVEETEVVVAGARESKRGIDMEQSLNVVAGTVQTAVNSMGGTTAGTSIQATGNTVASGAVSTI